MDDRRAIAEGLAAAFATGRADVFAPTATLRHSDPVGDLTGRDAIAERWLAPIRTALTPAERRPLIVIGGANRRAEGGQWVAIVAHTAGRFTAPLWGVAPHDRLALLRSGEIYRIEEGRIVAATVIVDLLDLLRQTGRLPVPQDLGAEITWPGPATQDGVCPPREGGAESLDLIERMLADLHPYDPATMDSPSQTGAGGAWAPDLMWWGPGGIGSTVAWRGFVDHHRGPFLTAFPDRKGGNHYMRIGDGAYAAISGWPSMTMTHRGPYLGLAATDRPLTLRVMDFYRCGGGRIAENWVLLDLIHLMRQMGRDVLTAADTP